MPNPSEIAEANGRTDCALYNLHVWAKTLDDDVLRKAVNLVESEVVSLLARATRAEARCRELERVGNLFRTRFEPLASIPNGWATCKEWDALIDKPSTP